MKKYLKIRYSFEQFLFSSFLDKTLMLVIITAITSAGFTFLFTKLNKTGLIICCIVLVMGFIAHLILSKEGKRFSKTDFEKFKPLDSRIKPIVIWKDSGIYVSRADLPVAFDIGRLRHYSVQFRVKVITECFGFCFNLDDNSNGYMIQYSPNTRKIRPHICLGLLGDISRWKVPSDISRELNEYENANFITINGSYFLRFEIETRDVKYEEIKGSLLIESMYKNLNSDVLSYEKINFSKSVHLRIYDMNDHAKIKYETVFTEPPLKIFQGKYIGFRNFHYESAIYSDLKVIQY